MLGAVEAGHLLRSLRSHSTASVEAAGAANANASWTKHDLSQSRMYHVTASREHVRQPVTSRDVSCNLVNRPAHFFVTPSGAGLAKKKSTILANTVPAAKVSFL